MNQITVSTPGRICLFGEHQDYLGLPVIAAAISRRVWITGNQSSNDTVTIDLPDIGEKEKFKLNAISSYSGRDYFKSSLNVLRKKGIQFEHGFNAEVKGNIPIQSGTSSSSALIVSWINFVLTAAGKRNNFSAARIADFAYQAEVVEFGEPGGMMDHYSTAIGDVIHLQSDPDIKIEKIKPRLGAFVLGDSLEPKDTFGMLDRVKRAQQEAIHEMLLFEKSFDVHHAKHEDLEGCESFLGMEKKRILYATIYNQNLTKLGLRELRKENPSHTEIGRLLNEHHSMLSRYLEISTPKIERMIEAALNAGAVGAKINGSGGGGCMFAYAPDDPESVAKAIEKAGGKAYIIDVDEGTRIDG